MSQQVCTFCPTPHKELMLSVEALWEATRTNRVYSIPVADLQKFLDEPYWDDENGQEITPSTVIQTEGLGLAMLQNNLSRVPTAPDTTEKGLWYARKHWDAIQLCDLSYPIIVSGDEQHLKINDILDGLHRLSKSVITQRATILVRFASPTDVQMSTIRERPVDDTQ